jgi:hypothetical protein
MCVGILNMKFLQNLSARAPLKCTSGCAGVYGSLKPSEWLLAFEKHVPSFVVFKGRMYMI